MSRVEKARARIAAGKQILPRFVFPDPEDIGGGKYVDDLLGLFEETKTLTIDEYFAFAEALLKPDPKYILYEQYTSALGDEAFLSPGAFEELQETGISKMEACYYYVYKTKEEIQMIDYINENLTYFDLTRPLDEDNFTRNIQLFAESFPREVKEFSEQSRQQLASRVEMDELKSEVSIVEQSILRSFLIFECKTDLDPLEHLNTAVVSRTVPYLTVHPYSKIYQGSKVYTEQWNTKNPNALVGYIRTAQSENERSYSQFQLDGKELRLESRSKDVGVSDPGTFMKEAINQSLQEIQIGGLVKEEISVECFIKNVDLSAWAFKHFIYTDPLMRHFYFLDESNIMERRRSFMTLYYYREPSRKDQDPIVITLSNRPVGEKQTKELSSNSCHTRVYVKRCTREELQYTLEDLGRCFSRFLQERPRLIRELSEISDSVKEDTEKQCRKRKKDEEEEVSYAKIFEKSENTRKIKMTAFGVLDRINTNVFRIINPDPEDAADIELYQEGDEKKQKTEVLIYPKRSDQDKMKPYGFYVIRAETDERVYIGLSEDPTMVDPPYIVNRFKTDQMIATGKPPKQSFTPLMTYLTGQESSEKAALTTPITTAKLVGKKRIGRLLEEIDLAFRFVLPDYTIWRYGMFNFIEPKDKEYIPKEMHHASILYILAEATGVAPDIPALKSAMEKIIDTSAVYQTEAYEYTKDELKGILREGQYIDPRLFYSVLRELFQIEVILFNKAIAKNKHPFELCAPYYHSPTTSDNVFGEYVMVAINPGGEFDHIPFPLCEICYLTKQDKGKPKAFRYPIDGEEESKLFQVYSRQYLPKMFGMESAIYRFTQPVTHQSFDSFGRMSWLHFGEVHAKLVTPHHAESYPVLPERNYLNNEAAVRQFLRQEQCIQVVEDRDKDMRLLGLTGIFSGKIPFRYYFPLYQEQESKLVVYRAYERISRYITEYAYLAFSLYLEEKKNPDWNEFAQQHFLIKEGHNYNSDTQRRWTARDTSYLIDGKVVVTSETMKTKLMYLIRQKYRTNESLMMLYYLLEYMPNYYASVADFAEMPKTLIVDRPFENRVQETGSIYMKESLNPYLLYKTFKEFSHPTWLCQPADSLPHATWICEQWNQTSANPMEKGELVAEYTLLRWDGPMSYSIIAGDPKRVISEIQLPNGKMHYQAMLPYLLM